MLFVANCHSKAVTLVCNALYSSKLNNPNVSSILFLKVAYTHLFIMCSILFLLLLLRTCLYRGNNLVDKLKRNSISWSVCCVDTLLFQVKYPFQVWSKVLLLWSSYFEVIPYIDKPLSRNIHFFGLVTTSKSQYTLNQTIFFLFIETVTRLLCSVELNVQFDLKWRFILGLMLEKKIKS